MPRRPPPTPLRLVQGPLPLRSKPRHTLPSVPRPTYVPRVPAAKIPKARPRARIVGTEAVPIVLTVVGRNHPALYDQSSGPTAQFSPTLSRKSSWSESDGSCSPVSVDSHRSSVSLSRRSSYDLLELSDDGRGGAVPLRPRGPWDHSSSIKIPFDVSVVLPPPRPAAMNVSVAR